MRSDKLDRADFEFAIDHAMRTHALAEQQRERLASCTDLLALRQTLVELGLPAADIDASLATLEQSFAERERRAIRFQRLVYTGLAFAATLFAIALYLVLRPPPVPLPPLALVSVEYLLPEQPATHTWQDSDLISGDVERALRERLQQAGIGVVESLTGDQRRQLFAGSARQPDLALLSQQLPATIAVLGRVRCTDRGTVMETEMHSWLISLELRATVVREQPLRVAAEHKADKVALHVYAAKGCAKGLEELLRTGLPAFEQQLLAAGAAQPVPQVGPGGKIK